MSKEKPYHDRVRQPLLFDMNDDPSGDFEVILPKTAATSESKANDAELTEISKITIHKSFRFISFGSGSSGNCAYIGTEKEGILIDAGIDIKQVFDTLAKYQITPEMVKGVCLSHDHSDHVRFAYTYIRKYRHLNVYCTPRVMSGMLRKHSISRRIKEQHVAIFKEIPFKLGGMTITAFEVPHDGSDNAGFFIEYDNLKFGVATDLGFVSPRANFYLSQAQFMMLESNYDRNMLDTGKYPEYLKNRVRGENGHLDNKDAANFICEQYHDYLKYIFLCHLSNDNNTPETARNEFIKTLAKKEITVGEGEGSAQDNDSDIQIVALPRFEASQLYILR